MNVQRRTTNNARIESWMARLSTQKLPAFAHTARSLAYVSRDDDSSADDLSNIILHDTAMTARILRVANSVHYNPTGVAIETVSYATVVLGFEQVRNLALTISMIDTVLGVEPKKQIQNEMVCGYHAAVQAQRLVQESDRTKLESVYIGGLLHRLGPIMFWCFPFGQGDALLEAYDESEDRWQAERSVLGFTLDDLTAALVSEWKLSAMLEQALGSEASRHEDESVISIGSGIADNIDKGWESDVIGRKIDAARKYLNVSPTKARNHVYESARIATEGLQSFGFPQTYDLLPPKNESESEAESSRDDNSELELRIVRQLTHMLSGNVDINRVLMAALEGIYRVLNADQVVFAVINPKTSTLQVKLMIGKRRDAIINRENKEHSTGTCLKQIFASTRPEWMTPAKIHEFDRDDLDPLINQLGAAEFFINPVSVQGRPIGVIYADRYAHQVPFTQKDLDSFSHLAEHATLSFKVLAKQKPERGPVNRDRA